MKTRHTRAPLLVGVSALLILGLSACGATTDAGSSEGAEGAEGTEEIQPLVAGVIPVTDIGPVYMAQQNGLFEENGFDLTLQPAGSSTEIIQAMQSGQVQVGYGGSTGVFQAVENGVDLVIVAAASATPDDPENGINDLLVTADSPLTSARDLEGKKVAVNAPGGYTQLLADIAVKADGGDPAKVSYVQMGVPDQPAALDSGAIDAFVAGEPFGTLGREENGFRTLANPFEYLSDSAAVAGVWYALRSDVEKRPDYYAKVVEAIDAANAYALANDEELRENIAEFTKIDPALAARIRLGSYGKLPLTVENLQPIADWSLELGYVKKPVDFDTLIWEP
ncbi:ABC transporter substrate-binding protein [Microbacterium caowuchunii]|uniref:ABC transporter substrate-binding protein n=1 Tax=Microbacterium caowuchunii TaxID=2614638 RepID=UPI0012482699|nr:ABC transporter substrate-binding protein [Microbacterium caowuchunii]QEW00998.1 ABC transporter substrate-binding protein [Microbacterium caowuchunii]